MRTQFAQVSTRYQAQKECPWAAHIMKVVGGFMCYESHDDYYTARRQR